MIHIHSYFVNKITIEYRIIDRLYYFNCGIPVI